MLAIMIFALLILLSLIFPKSKWLTLGILVFMWILFGLCTYNGDFKIYEWLYNSSEQYSTAFEPGFQFLIYVCNKIGLSFYGFRIVLATVSAGLFLLVIKKYTRYTAFAAAGYMIFPFLYFSSVVRGGIAGLIIAYGFQFLLTGKNKDKIKYCVAVAAAMFFHFTSILFLGLLVVKRKVKAKEFALIFVMGMLLYIMISSNYIYTVLSMITQRPKILGWFKDMQEVMHPNINGIIVILFRLLGNITAVLIARRIYNRKIRELNMCRNNFADMLFSANLLMLSITPLFMYADSFLRIIYVVMILNICLYANVFELIKIKMQRGLTIFAPMVLCWHLVILILSDLPYIGTENCVWLIFSNNLLLKLF